MTKFILHGDVDAIKNFVFETSSLPQIRGGSQLLIDCEDKIKCLIREETGQEPIYCNGGSFLADNIPKEKLKTIQQRIEQIYLTKTHVSTITTASREFVTVSTVDSPQDGWARRLWQSSQQEGFGYQVTFLATQVREKKTHKKESPFFEAYPFGKRCESCGMRMATTEIRRPDPDSERVNLQTICSVCLVRHERGQHEQTSRIKGKYNYKFYKKYSLRLNQAPDLDHLVESASRNYLAFIYADGNDIGGELQKFNTIEQFKDFSKALEKSTKVALFETLQGVLGQDLKQEKTRWCPFDIINVGGDDITILIQAGYAWEVAVEFLERFEAETEKNIGKKLTASCGIAIAHAHYPMNCLQQLAEGLLKRAKQQAKSQITKESAIDFLWLPNTVLSEEVEPLLVPYTQNNLQLIARPYTLTQAKQVSQLVQQAVTWPRSQRSQWAEATERGPWVSLNQIYYNIARHDKRQESIEFMNRVGMLVGSDYPELLFPGLWKWDSDEKTYKTALLDILELAELQAMRPRIQGE